MRTVRYPRPAGSRTWSSFAGDQTCRPWNIEYPAGRDELRTVVEAANRAGRTVRVAGAGHSPNDAVLTDGTLVSLRRMDRVLDVDRSSGLVRCQAGISLGALSERMWEHGLAFANLGDIDVQSIAGATATGTHGTGIRLPNLSARLHSVELTLADGSTVEVDAGGDADTYRAARLSLGALGVVTEVTLRAVPAFVLSGVAAAVPVDEVLASLDERVDGNDHFGFFLYPHSRLALTRTWNRTDEPVRPRSRLDAWVGDMLLTNYAWWGTSLAGRARPRWIPSINRFWSRKWGTSHRVDRSYRVFTTPRRVPLTEMEYAIPREHAAEAIKRVHALAEEARFDVPMPFEVRFSAPDDALLSPTGGREVCWVAVHQFAGMAWREVFREFEAVMVGYGGRPHWGKRHFRTAASLRPGLPDWERFAAVRDRLDPDRRFTNAYVERVLGP